MDEVPLLGVGGHVHVVGVELEVVELPLEDEQRRWKTNKEVVKLTYYLKKRSNVKHIIKQHARRKCMVCFCVKKICFFY